MGFLTLEDLYGSTEVLVFPKVFEQYGQDLQVDALVALGGRLSIREEESPKLLLSEVRPLVHANESGQPAEPAPRPNQAETRKLYLKVQDETQRGEALPFLQKTPGRIPVIFFHEDVGKAFKASADLWVHDKFDRAGLAGLLGESAVVLK